MTRVEVCEQNARFFPNDSEWAKHCAKVVAYLNSIPAITSKPGWAPFWWFVAIAFSICATLNILREQGILT